MGHRVWQAGQKNIHCLNCVACKSDQRYQVRLGIVVVKLAWSEILHAFAYKFYMQLSNFF